MFGFLADFQRWLGVELDWGAIGSFLALCFAIHLSNRQNADARRREAAVVNGVMATALPMLEALKGFKNARSNLSSFLEDNPQASGWDEEGSKGVVAFLQRHGELGAQFNRLHSERRSAYNWALVQAERVFKRLQGIDPLTLPSTSAIEALHELELSVELCLPPKRGTPAETFHGGTLQEQLPVMAEQIERLSQVASRLAQGRRDIDTPVRSRPLGNRPSAKGMIFGRLQPR